MQRIRLYPNNQKISLHTFLYVNALYLEIFKTLDDNYGVTFPSLYKNTIGSQRSVVGFGNTIKKAFDNLIISLDYDSCENQEWSVLKTNGNTLQWPKIYLNWPEMRKLVSKLPLHNLKK